MGWIDFLKGSDRTEDTGDKAGSAPSAVEYVAWLTTFMLKASRTDLTIDTNAPLPGADGTGESAPPCVPSPESVINRLKLVSGLNPVRLSAPGTGSFEDERGGHILVVSTRFEDWDDRSTCRLQIRVRPRTG